MSKQQQQQQMRFATQFVSPCVEGPTVATPNIVAVAVGAVAEPQPIATGDAFRCSNAACGAILSRADAGRLKRPAADSPDRVWTCVFCGTQTTVRIEPEEVPASSVVDYITAAPASAAAAASATAGEGDVCSIFVLDVSGSMCVTCEVKGNRRKQYVSRLECVQQALTAQITELVATAASRRVSLLTFSEDVEIIGDGSSAETVTVAGDKLNDWDALIAIGKAQAVGAPVLQTAAKLKERVAKLEEKTSTALGPALLLAVAMASQRPGSRIVVLTDGLANVGLGAIEGTGSDATAAVAEAAGFYQKVGQLARDSGVTVSVLGIAGSRCCLENLGKVADLTGGVVDLVNPQDLSFKDSVAKSTKATGVSLRLLVHPSLNLGNGATVRSELVGNVNEDSACTFAVFTKPGATPPSEIPFQAQISFTKLDGSRCIRVISVVMPFISDVRAAVRDIDVLTVGLHVSKLSAQLVQDGRYDQARKTALEYRALLEGAIHTPQQREHMAMFLRQLREGESALDRAKEEELALGIEVDESTEDAVRYHSMARGDSVAASMYAMKSHKAAACLVM